MKNPFITGFKEGFKAFGHSVANIVNFFLLTLVYLVGVGPTSLVAKLFGKKFLQTKLNKDSFWVMKDQAKEKAKKREDHYRTF